MTHLEDVVGDMNFMVSIFGKGRAIDVNAMDQKDADTVYEQIDCDLSPENLSCDGEATAAHMKSQSTKLRGALKELKARGFIPPHNMTVGVI